MGNEMLVRLSGNNAVREPIVVEYLEKYKRLDPIKRNYNYLILNKKQAFELVVQLQNFIKQIDNPKKAFVKSENIEILKYVICNNFGITMDELKKKSQSPVYSTPRSLFYCIMYEYGGQSLENCAKHFNQNHCTVLHALKVINNILITKDNRYYDKIISVLELYNIKELCDVKISD